MSQENVEIARTATALFNSGDFDAAFALVHPDVEFRDLQGAPDLPETVHGRDALGLVLAQWIDAYDDFRAEPLNYIDAHPWVVADVRWHGKGKGSDVLVNVRQADTLKVEGGKIVAWIVGYADVPTALKAVGLAE